MKSELFAKILHEVAEVTELTEEEILSKRKTEELVAARSLLVHHCIGMGLPSISLARLMRRCDTHSVNRYSASYVSFRRMSYLFREMDGRIARAIAEDRGCN